MLTPASSRRRLYPNHLCKKLHLGSICMYRSPPTGDRRIWPTKKLSSSTAAKRDGQARSGRYLTLCPGQSPGDLKACDCNSLSRMRNDTENRSPHRRSAVLLLVLWPCDSSPLRPACDRENVAVQCELAQVHADLLGQETGTRDSVGRIRYTSVGSLFARID